MGYITTTSKMETYNLKYLHLKKKAEKQTKNQTETQEWIRNNNK